LLVGALLIAAPSATSAQNSGKFVGDMVHQLVVPFESIGKAAQPAAPAKARKAKRSKGKAKAKRSRKGKSKKS